jgi:hypothetical protein
MDEVGAESDPHDDEDPTEKSPVLRRLKNKALASTLEAPAGLKEVCGF